MLEVKGCREEGGKGEGNWENCNSIINKNFFKKIKVSKYINVKNKITRQD